MVATFSSCRIPLVHFTAAGNHVCCSSWPIGDGNQSGAIPILLPTKELSNISSLCGRNYSRAAHLRRQFCPDHDGRMLMSEPHLFTVRVAQKSGVSLTSIF